MSERTSHGLAPRPPLRSAACDWSPETQHPTSSGSPTTARFTPGCTTESCDFRDNYAAFQKAGYEIVGVSPDPAERLSDFKDEYDLPFPLLADPDHEMADAYGAWGMKKNYGKEYEGLIRSTIVVDEQGRVEKAWYNVRAKGHADRVAGEVANS